MEDSIITQFNPRIVIIALQRLNKLLNEAIEVLTTNGPLERLVSLQRDKVAIFNYLDIQAENIRQHLVLATDITAETHSTDTTASATQIKELLQQMNSLHHEYIQLLDRRHTLGVKFRDFVIDYIRQSHDKAKGTTPNLPTTQRKWLTYSNEGIILTDNSA